MAGCANDTKPWREFRAFFVAGFFLATPWEKWSIAPAARIFPPHNHIRAASSMEFSAILLISLALAVDAFAVALAAGVSLCQVNSRQVFRLAFHFGFFQAGMNILGWLGGLTVRSYIESFDHWLAFGLLAFVGIKMIWEAIREVKEEGEGMDPTRGRMLITLSVATSIDSLAVGLSFAVLEVSVWLPALVIGLVASGLTALGLRLGCLLGAASRLGSRAEIAGGLVLLGIGLKILHEHGVL
jgi:putative Mn2+ efflux pump MntP